MQPHPGRSFLVHANKQNEQMKIKANTLIDKKNSDSDSNGDDDGDGDSSTNSNITTITTSAMAACRIDVIHKISLVSVLMKIK